jgi:superfamily II DNA or RNA helicase
MKVDIGFKEMFYLAPTKSPCLYSQFIGRVRRLPPNIAASLNKDSIRIMDGMLIIGWINKSPYHSDDSSMMLAQSVYGQANIGKYSVSRAFIEAEYKAHSKHSVNVNIIKTRNLPNARY